LRYQYFILPANPRPAFNNAAPHIAANTTAGITEAAPHTAASTTAGAIEAASHTAVSITAGIIEATSHTAASTTAGITEAAPHIADPSSSSAYPPLVTPVFVYHSPTTAFDSRWPVCFKTISFNNERTRNLIRWLRA
jgi:hypothetical protein